MTGIYRGILERIERDPATVLRAADLAAGLGEGLGGGAEPGRGPTGRHRSQLATDRSAPVSDRRVAIVGGGLAGITAALDCARAGAAVTLLESRGRLGGAAYSFTRDGILADNGQHVFLRCCTAYREPASSSSTPASS